MAILRFSTESEMMKPPFHFIQYRTLEIRRATRKKQIIQLQLTAPTNVLSEIIYQCPLETTSFEITPFTMENLKLLTNQRRNQFRQTMRRKTNSKIQFFKNFYLIVLIKKTIFLIQVRYTK